MKYIGNIIRPPNEAESIILQKTTGCSHNKCTFCPAYKDKPFSIRNTQEIFEDIEDAKQNYSDNTSLFLCDGDPLIIPHSSLMNILGEIKRQLPQVVRISTYASAKAIAKKTNSELAEYRQTGLRMIHCGLESGDDITLAKIKKYGDSKFMIDQLKRVHDVGISTFITILTGVGGIERTEEHAIETGRVLSAIDPLYIGALSLMIVEGTELFERASQGNFTLPSPQMLLKELRTIIDNTNVTNSLFYANHASNYLPLRIRLPRDKQGALEQIDAALQGNIKLKPEWLRGL